MDYEMLLMNDNKLVQFYFTLVPATQRSTSPAILMIKTKEESASSPFCIIEIPDQHMFS